ncbi:undecaprenyldiphospho-muramoylpentapeptide beta-N-acetylglucosaminyltransferase [Flavobacteriaceae bacterium]|nr:undecaprenyldiphospho-muramoylpentapeptide beta-N-acetylglucosaminyltransferase [Flavobacteriaceae bacterium]MDA9016301.1 undecaprenyldiphospho-muramoylpentapeptide beta-N-acetylglucosaminyltransferase [Flavobacteriaceae bacterium]MDA9572241.1 undecaprenyldiphospho-muramoylpentapeptide beta-N-acetylglucosaminyltransferase [Flavobacteriaceae bacterium]MDC3354747.1 undecaprenyldiphospho-muramoylpentapeptide beta-N-acetylglucosaminyltransferase [Flavobacteriaceae bacterium]
MKAIRLIVSGGGTGGHIYPALAIASQIKMEAKDAAILFVGAQGKMEMEKVPKAGFPIKGVWISGFQRSLSVQNLIFPFKLVVSLIQAFLIIKKFKPNIVVGTGGFASGPVLQIAQWLGIPTLIQEQNSYPGITNKLLSKKVNKICVAFDGMERFFPADKLKITGNPIRSNVEKQIASAEAKKFFGLDPKKQTLAIIGGSLGARRVNELISDHLDFIQSFDLQVLWQCGALYYDQYKKKVKDGVVIHSFINEMQQFYSAADLIISRAGAGSLSELCNVGKPLLLIPSPNVTANHQYHNASALEKKKAAFVIEEKNLETDFKEVFRTLVLDIDIQKRMHNQLKSLAKPNAASSIVKEIRLLL